jgi:cell division inhibitor SepF
MAGAMRKMGVYLGLVEDDDIATDSYERVAPVPERVVARRDDSGYGRAMATEERHVRAEAYVKPEAYAEPEPAAGEYAEYEYPSYRITTLHPRTYNEARTIGEQFRSHTPVIMNLSEMDDADAKRLVDFAAGLTFGLQGRIERVTAKVFLLSPHNVTVTAQDKARIAEGWFFNQS